MVQILAIETGVRYGFFALFVDIQPDWVRLVLGAIGLVSLIVSFQVRKQDLTSHIPGRVLIVAAMFAVSLVALVVTSSDLAVIASFSLLGLTMSAIALDEYRAGTVIGVVGTVLALVVMALRSSTPIAPALIYLGLVVTGVFLIIRLRQFLELARDDAITLAHTDPLTGLLNRRGMELEVPRLDALARSTGRLLGCLVLDLDHFKTVNDRLGHRTGDQVLQRTALALKATIRENDLAVRTGGEEFAIFAVVAAADELAQLAERLRRQLAEPTVEPRVTVSIGGAVGAGATASDISALFELADRVLYTAKKAGRNTVRMHGMLPPRPLVGFDAYGQPAPPTLYPGDILAGIENHSVFVVYQPIVKLDSETIVGYEALARLVTPDGVNVSPPMLITEAREHGLLDALTMDIISEAYEAMESFLAIQPHADTLHVNIEAPQIASIKLIEHIKLMQSTHPSVKLRLEFTEASIADLDAASLAHMTALTRDGIDFALDDYGQDHATAAALLSLPLHTVKIDKVFLADEGNNRHKIILSSVADLVTDLEMQTIVEGVETQIGHQTLLDLGIQHAQGYLYGRPATADDTVERLKQSGLTMWIQPESGHP
ncbi:EAL domain-containing protein [Subtercola vilae]|uniref:EAL domain-containing protein n=1 Tax=Subtercola vilae TaxID=2056433 RepID=A0A4T2BRD5_9MICO|nr:EAL domain-containing protein [Subtercola vilae]